MACCHDTVYKAGDAVEYYSTTNGRWITATVTFVHADGLYNLDCKPGVRLDQIRHPRHQLVNAQHVCASGDVFNPGDVVEYSSTSEGRWILAQVLRLNANGTIALDCKGSASPDRIRRPRLENYEISKCLPGDTVEYFCTTQEKWLPAKVLSIAPNGIFNLDCHSKVPAGKLRRVDKGSETRRSDIPPRLEPVTFSPDPAYLNSGASKIGDAVENISSSRNKLLQAKVLTVNQLGTRDLDCQPDVLFERMRKQGPTIDCKPDSWAGRRCKQGSSSDKPELTPESELPAVNKFVAGDSVEYWSSTHGRWIHAKVLSINPHGTYNLDCKADVKSERVRQRQNCLASRSEFVPESSILQEVTEVCVPQTSAIPDALPQQYKIPSSDCLDTGRLSGSGRVFGEAADAGRKYFGATSSESFSGSWQASLPSTSRSNCGLRVQPSIADRPPGARKCDEQELRDALLCFGDSLTQGFCFTKGQIVPYTDRLAQRLTKRVAVVNGGMSGHTTRDMLARLPKLLEAGHCSGSTGTPKPFSFVVILGGTNDLNQASDEKEAILRNVCALHREVQRNNPNARTAVVTVPSLHAQATSRNMDADRQWINASLRAFAECDPRRRLLIDLAAAIPQDEAHAELWDPDGVHFSPAGYQVMGDVIGDAICSFDRALGHEADPKAA